jgi:hypothetical protein
MLATTFKDNKEVQEKIESLLKEKNRKYNKTESKLVENGIEYEILGSDDLFLGVAIMAAGASTYTR